MIRQYYKHFSKIQTFQLIILWNGLFVCKSVIKNYKRFKMSTGLPEINRRIKEVVEHYANGNVSKFVQMLSQNGEDVSQQKFNRVFNIDTRTKKYPGVPSSITTAITNCFKEVNASWLLTGEGEMLVHPGKPAPGDRMNPMRAYMLAIADDYATWRVEKEMPTASDKEKQAAIKKIKQGIGAKAKLILDGLDEWPFEDLKG